MSEESKKMHILVWTEQHIDFAETMKELSEIRRGEGDKDEHTFWNGMSLGFKLLRKHLNTGRILTFGICGQEPGDRCAEAPEKACTACPYCPEEQPGG